MLPAPFGARKPSHGARAAQSTAGPGQPAQGMPEHPTPGRERLTCSTEQCQVRDIRGPVAFGGRGITGKARAGRVALAQLVPCPGDHTASYLRALILSSPLPKPSCSLTRSRATLCSHQDLLHPPTWFLFSLIGLCLPQASSTCALLIAINPLGSLSYTLQPLGTLYTLPELRFYP